MHQQQPQRRLTCSLRHGLPWVLASFVLLLLSATGYGQQNAQLPDGDVKSVEAVVHAPGYTGACWLLITKYGRLEPTNLTPEFKIDGLKVVISFTTRHDLASACMMGSIVTLSSIVREGT